jgi:hypothetical protein
LDPREEAFTVQRTAVSEGDFVSVLQRIHSPGRKTAATIQRRAVLRVRYRSCPVAAARKSHQLMCGTMLDIPRSSIRIHRGAALLGLAAVMASCTPPGPANGPTPSGRERQHSGPPLGFDTSRYPGDAAMRTWRAESPYRWVGYYLPSPCHRDSTWVGRRQALSAMGWGTAVVYVGQQDWVNGGAAPATPTPTPAPATPADTAATPPPPGQCATARLTTQQGTTDADDAIAKALAEGFAAGSYVYLDVERVRTISPGLDAYVRAWMDRVLVDGRYQPALYVHAFNAQALHDVAQAVYAQRNVSRPPRFWIASLTGFTTEGTPAGSGFPFADIWQGQHGITEAWGGVSLLIDVNLSTADSPSAR